MSEHTANTVQDLSKFNDPTWQNMDYARSVPSNWNGSPRDISRAKTAAVCSWIYRWGFTSSKIIEQLGQSRRVGLAARLVRNGLLKKTPVPNGGYLPGEVSFIFTLTELGVQVAQHVENDAWAYQLDPHKRNFSIIRHELVCQNCAVPQFVRGLSDSRFKVLPDAMSVKKSDKTKQADCLLIYPSPQMPTFRLAVEVELTKKTGRILDEFILKVYEALKRVPDENALKEVERLKEVEQQKVNDLYQSVYYKKNNYRDPDGSYGYRWDWTGLPTPAITYKGVLWDGLVILSDIKTLEKDYRDLMKEGATIKAWKRERLKWVENPARHLKVTKEMAQTLTNNVVFKPIDWQLK